MPMASGNSKSVNADPNVTPLIDVLLVLLTIFMVIVPVPPKGLEAALPRQAKSEQLSPTRTVVVQILATPAGPIYKINNESVPGKIALAAELNRIESMRAEKILFVQGDPALDFQSVAEVLDISRAVGIDHVGILTPHLGAIG
jgi:biopolymer transport protein TolR